jgi:hypothetical protein
MIEYLDLALSLVILTGVLVFIYSQYKLLPQEAQIRFYRNPQGVVELYHILSTGLVYPFSESSKFSILFYSNNSLITNLPSIQQGGAVCENFTYLSSTYGNITLEICY